MKYLNNCTRPLMLDSEKTTYLLSINPVGKVTAIAINKAPICAPISNSPKCTDMIYHVPFILIYPENTHFITNFMTRKTEISYFCAFDESLDKWDMINHVRTIQVIHHLSLHAHFVKIFTGDTNIHI